MTTSKEKAICAALICLGAEINDLSQWKRDMIKHSLDGQEIGKLLDVPIGTSITTTLVVEYIKALKYRLARYE